MRFIVGMSGASGSQYGVRLVRFLKQRDHEVHLIVSEVAEQILGHETGLIKKDLCDIVAADYTNDDMFALPASGSFAVDGMVIVPCSMKTLSAVATGYSDTLISRAALCQLKEGRRLVMVVRETPVDLIGLRNMVAACEAGAVVLPANPGFYHKPVSIDDVVDFVVGKILDQLHVSHNLKMRWKNPK